MAHCTKCGAVVTENAAFCGSCGAPQSITPGAPAGPPVAAATQPGLAENLAGALCYVAGWISGLIFLLVDKRPYVRFHAVQSIIVFGALHILMIGAGMLFGFGLLAGMAGFSVGWALYRLLDLLILILWILLMVKAYQGERFRVPVAADVGEKIFGKS
jgi:uncharacterized membrane protein